MAWTVTPGRTAPAESETVPRISPVCWATSGATASSKTGRKSATKDRFGADDILTSSISACMTFELR